MVYSETDAVRRLNLARRAIGRQQRRSGSRLRNGWRTGSAPGQAGAGPRMRAVALLRRLGRYDRAAYRSVARLWTPLLDEPLQAGVRLADFSKPWIVARRLCALLGGRQGRRAARYWPGGGRCGVPGGEPADEVGGQRHRPDREWLRRPAAAMDDHAGLDIVPFRSLRVRGRLRRCRRRRPAGPSAAAAGRSLHRRVFTRLHRRALPE